MKYLSNAFSLQMLDANTPTTIRVTPVTPEDVPADVFSVLGHKDTAAVVGFMLGRVFAPYRANINLERGDVLYVAQLQGGRLPEGATTLPKGYTITFFKVEIV